MVNMSTFSLPYLPYQSFSGATAVFPPYNGMYTIPTPIPHAPPHVYHPYQYHHPVRFILPNAYRLYPSYQFIG